MPETANALYEFLSKRHVEVAVYNETAKMLMPEYDPIVVSPEVLSTYELIIVVGGDGSLLNAAHLALPYTAGTRYQPRTTRIFNRYPSSRSAKSRAILDGHYHIEPRFLLEAHLYKEPVPEVSAQDVALNDVVLLPRRLSPSIDCLRNLCRSAIRLQAASGRFNHRHTHRLHGLCAVWRRAYITPAIGRSGVGAYVSPHPQQPSYCGLGR